METSAQSNPAIRSTEVRIALVMYGGVSLAVYINGCTREFFDLVRGRGVWGILKELADVDVFVDVISGASAGGINGLYLAYALSGGREFGPLSVLWRERAGFSQLLRDPDAADATSLVDGEYLQRELVHSFEAMDQAPPQPDLAPNSVPDQELDLFLAVTNYYGHVETVGDFRGQPVELKSYRGVLQVKHRPGRFEPFRVGSKDGMGHDLLARFARATSAFPVAFEPVRLEGSEAGKYFVGGRGPGKGEATYVVDGGVLDNHPFESALESIYGRHADRPVDRMLFFVDPDPPDRSELAHVLNESEVEAPNFATVSLASLSVIPGFESIAGDITNLDRHNRRLDVLNTVLEPPYSSPRPKSGADRVATDGADAEVPRHQWRTYLRARLFQLIERIAEVMPPGAIEALQQDVDRRDLRQPERGQDSGLPDGNGQGSFQRFFDALWKTGRVEFSKDDRSAFVRMGDVKIDLDDLDVAYVKRAFYHWIYELHAALSARLRGEAMSNAGGEAADGVRGTAQLRDAIIVLSRRVDMLSILEGATLRAVRALVGSSGPERVDENGASDYPGFDDLGVAWLAALTDVDEPSREEGPSGSAASLVAAVKEYGAERTISESPSTSPDLERFSQAVEGRTVARTGRAAVRARDLAAGPPPTSVLRAFLETLDVVVAPCLPILAEPAEESTEVLPLQRFRRLDAWRLPLLALSDLAEMDRVEYYRISPRDSRRVHGSSERLQRWDSDAMPKVAGRSLAHFGGFLKRSWRSNDILWGRVDAATVLWDVLVKRRGLQLSRDRAVDLLARRGDSLPERTRDLLELFCRGEIDKDALAKRLLAVHQEGLILEEVERVVKDSLAEEPAPAKTESGRTEAKAGDDPLLASLPRRPSDPLLTSVCQEAVGCQLANRRFDLGDFFQNHYDVGRQTPLNLDRLSLAVTFLHAARVFSNMGKRVLATSGWGTRVNRLFINRFSVGITSLHLAALGVRDGLFPVVWLSTLLGSLLVVLLYLVAPRDANLSASYLWVPLVLIAALLFAPGFWFRGPIRRVRWIALPALVAVALLGAYPPIRGRVIEALAVLGVWLQERILPVLLVLVAVLVLGRIGGAARRLFERLRKRPS